MRKLFDELSARGLDTVSNILNRETERIGDAEVHYVWINKRDDGSLSQEAREEYLSTVELYRFDKAFENARLYHDELFTLWVDKGAMDDMTRFWVESYFYDQAPDNMKLKDLRDIKSYDTSSVLHEKLEDGTSPYSVLLRSDLTRLIVLQEALRQEGREYVVYVDLDGETVLSLTPKADSVLNKYGLILGKTNGEDYAQGYIALKRGFDKSHDFLRFSIENSYKYFTGEEHRVSNCEALMRSMDAVYGFFATNQMGVKKMPELCVKARGSEFLSENGICAFDYER